MFNLYDVLEKHRDNKRDKRVFGLVVQGGGMRAVYSAGALITLIEYGLSDVFDHVVGSSAGAMNAAYFLCQDKEAAGVYTDHLTTKNFVNLLRKDKKVNIDYVIDVLKSKLPLDIKALNKSKVRFHVVVTDAKTGKLDVLSDHHKFKDIYEELRATAALPVLYDKEVKVGNKLYVDGGVADLLPVDVAYKLGCTDIVVLMTQRIDSYRFDQRHTRLINHLIKHFARNKAAALRRKLPTDEHLLQVNLRRLRHPWRGVNIYLLEPSNEEMLFSLATIDKPKVEELAKLGVTDMDKFLQKELGSS